MEKLALNISEAAEAIGVSKPTMVKLIHTDGFPVKKIGSRYLIPVSALIKWLENNI